MPEMFDLEINAGRYLAGDWGATTTVSRKFGAGGKLADTQLLGRPFCNLWRGLFDKAIFISIPIDWIVSTPNKEKATNPKANN